MRRAPAVGSAALLADLGAIVNAECKALVAAGARYNRPERLWLTPDCGFGETPRWVVEQICGPAKRHVIR